MCLRDMRGDSSLAHWSIFGAHESARVCVQDDLTIELADRVAWRLSPIGV